MTDQATELSPEEMAAAEKACEAIRNAVDTAEVHAALKVLNGIDPAVTGVQVPIELSHDAARMTTIMMPLQFYGRS